MNKSVWGRADECFSPDLKQDEVSENQHHVLMNAGDKISRGMQVRRGELGSDEMGFDMLLFSMPRAGDVGEHTWGHWVLRHGMI